MVSALALTIIVVFMIVIGLFGFLAGGWWFVIGFLLGIMSLGLAASTSSWLRSWFAKADDYIDDEQGIEWATRTGRKVTS